VAGDAHGEERAMLSNDRVDGFRCTLVPARITPDAVIVAPQVLEALEMEDGQIGRVRSFDV